MKTLAGIRHLTGLALALTVLSACAGTPVSDRLTAQTPDGLPQQVELSETPFFAQTENYCGPAAMAAALNATGLDTSPDELGETLFTPGREGTLQSDVITSARRQGRLALPVTGIEPAFRTLAAGRPVMILQNLALEMAPQWHYALLIGYDLPAKTAILRSGETQRLEMPLETLEHTWRRGDFWGVVLVEPEGPVPPTVSSSQWIAEAAGLERAGQASAAETAYRTALREWPDAALAWIAMANQHYGAGRLGESEAALRRAVALEPENGAAWNNLAQVLFERGDRTGAAEAVDEALSLDGSHLEAARRTRDRIKGS